MNFTHSQDAAAPLSRPAGSRAIRVIGLPKPATIRLEARPWLEARPCRPARMLAATLTGALIRGHDGHEVDFPGELGFLNRMATATLHRSAEKKRLWTYDKMVAELPEFNLPVELWDGELNWSLAPEAHANEFCTLEQGTLRFHPLANQGETATSKRLSRVKVTWAELLL